MSKNVAEQVRRLVEDFDEGVEAISASEVLARSRSHTVDEGGHQALHVRSTHRASSGLVPRVLVAATFPVLLVVLAGSLWWVASTRESAPNDRLAPADAPVTSVRLDSATVPTSKNVPSTIVPEPPSTTGPPPISEMATASPEVVHPQEPVTLTPGAAIERNCSDTVVVYDFDNAIIGQVTDGENWEPATSSAFSESQPACPTVVSADSVTIIVPPLTTGGYRFCISVANDFRGCPTVFIASTT